MTRSTSSIDELRDRYGEPPADVEGLLAVARLRRRAAQAGLADVVAMGPNLRIAPANLPDSMRVRLQRLYPSAKLLAGGDARRGADAEGGRRARGGRRPHRVGRPADRPAVARAEGIRGPRARSRAPSRRQRCRSLRALRRATARSQEVAALEREAT